MRFGQLFTCCPIITTNLNETRICLPEHLKYLTASITTFFTTEIKSPFFIKKYKGVLIHVPSQEILDDIVYKFSQFDG